MSNDLILESFHEDRMRAESAEADAGRLVAALESITDPDPCTAFDHHGYCQTHGWLSEGLCGHAAAREALRLHRELDAGH